MKQCWEQGNFDYQRSPQNYCKDCGVEIGLYSTRCKGCNNKWRWRNGDLNNQECVRKRSKGIKEAWRRGAYKDIFEKIWTLDRRYAQSQRKKANWVDGLYGTMEWRLKKSKAMKEAWQRGDFDGVFKPPTSIELQIAAALDIMGIDHKTQYRPKGSRWPFDEFIPPNLLVELQGDYWHSLEESKERDAEKALWAKVHGFRLVEIWEHEVKKNGAWALVAQRIGAAIVI